MGSIEFLDYSLHPVHPPLQGMVDNTILVFQTLLSEVRRRSNSKFGNRIGNLERRVSGFMQQNYSGEFRGPGRRQRLPLRRRPENQMQCSSEPPFFPSARVYPYGRRPDRKQCSSKQASRLSWRRVRCELPKDTIYRVTIRLSGFVVPRP